MSCMTVIAPTITMATTQFMGAACYQNRSRFEEQFPAQYQALRMKWVVVTDENGNRRTCLSLVHSNNTSLTYQ